MDYEVPVKKTVEKTISLTSRISSANSKVEVENLLAEGATYKGVSPDTVRKWDKAARFRIAAITAS